MISFVKPSEQKIKRLRAEGNVFISSAVLRIFLLVLIFGLLITNIQILQSFFKNYFQLFNLIVDSDFVEIKKSLSNLAFKIIFVPTIIVVVCVFLIALFQSKFYFSLKRISFGVSRFNPISNFKEKSFLQKLLINSILLPICLLLAIILFYELPKEFYALISLESQVFAIKILSIFKNYYLFLLLLFFILAPILYLLGISNYYYKNRMTQDDLKNEDVSKTYIHKI